MSSIRNLALQRAMTETPRPEPTSGGDTLLLIHALYTLGFLYTPDIHILLEMLESMSALLQCPTALLANVAHWAAWSRTTLDMRLFTYPPLSNILVSWPLFVDPLSGSRTIYRMAVPSNRSPPHQHNSLPDWHG